MSNQPAFLNYSEGVETRSEDEPDTIQKIIRSMTEASQTVAKRDGQTVRASHAKSTGLLKGELTVLEGLSPELRQGIFAEPRTYPVLVRLAQGPGEVLSDSVSTHRGMSIKLLGVEGEKLAGHTGNQTQDFVLATGPVFPQKDASSFLTAIRGVDKNAGMPEGVKQAVSNVARTANAVMNAVGQDSPTFGFFGHTKRSPLADAYFSQASLRYGDYIAKIGVFPASPDLIAAVDDTLDTSRDENAFRTAVVSHMRARGAEFEVRVQLCTNLEQMPVENSSVQWPEDASPYRTVARLFLPAQAAYSLERQTYFDEVLSFQPAHTLAAHRPLGSLMRARLATYQALSAHRHIENGKRQVEPAGIDEVPD